MNLRATYWYWRFYVWPYRRSVFQDWWMSRKSRLRYAFWKRIKWPLFGRPPEPLADGVTDDTESLQWILDRDGYLHGGENVAHGQYRLTTRLVVAGNG